MFNITENTILTGLEKTGCTWSHINSCMNEKGKHEKPVFTYYGPQVSKGSILVHTKNGDFTVRFDEKNGLARKVEII